MTEYRNPQNEQGTDKRMLIALVLVFVVLGILQFFLPKPQPPPPDKGQQQQQAQEHQTATPAVPAVSTPTPAKSPAVAPKLPVKSATAETESVLENESYRITFTNHGASVKSWILKKYKDDAGKPFDLVNQTVAAQLGNPLSLYTYDKDLQKRLNEALYVGGEEGHGTAGALTYEFSDGDVLVRKTFRTGKDYLLNVETEVMRNGQRVQALPQWPSGLGDQMAPVSFTKSTVDYQQGSTIERKEPSSGGMFSSKKWIVGGL
ncbi:MAG TPA: membrane protein insertase YidC, partial [Verrucomicrobiae bacterium]|nr:membrane protein insertase YidC [Verrucomicrobiae bacterium]